ncbi:MAG: TRZ/ATZ family hydrolase [Gammaproteobacteria bacterium]|nr:TRZ/ATZ family hydrolase [Gammaproteobacteria bacterium]
MQVDWLIEARWIIPVEPEGTVYEHHALVVDGGRIIDLVPEDEAHSRYQASHRKRLEQHALIPGLVNAHTHAAMTLMRGIADDRPLRQWLNEHIWPLERRWVGEAFVRDGVQLALAEMLRGGVTCFNDMYFYPEVTARQCIQVGMRAAIGMILVDFPTNWAETPDDYFTKGLALHDEMRHQPLVTTGFAPHAPYSVSDAVFLRMQTLAAELDCPVTVHLHETADEIDESRRTYGMRPFKRLQQLDVLGPQLVAVHMTQLNDEEIGALAECGGHVVHCPESNLKLASGFCPVERLLQAGINVAVGTDGAASNNDLDVLGETRTAALLAKAVAGDAAALPAPVALRMATLNGARALGLGEQIGSLTVGKYADVAAVKLGEIETLPLFDPISDLIYAASRHHVSDVWVAGRHLLNDRELTTLDAAEIRDKAESWRGKLLDADKELTK